MPNHLPGLHYRSIDRYFLLSFTWFNLINKIVIDNCLMLQYLPRISLSNVLTILVSFLLIWLIKQLFYILSVRNKGLKSFYQIPGYSFFLDWEVLNWPAQRLVTDLLLKRRKELGPIFTIKMRLFETNTVIISDPSMVESLYKIDGQHPSRRSNLTGFSLLLRFSKRPKGLLLSEGEDWSRMRKPVSRAILNPSIINQYIPELNDIAISLTERISDSLNENKLTSSLQFLVRCASMEGSGSFIYQKNMGYLSKNLSPKTKMLLDSAAYFFHCINLLSGYSFLNALLKSKKFKEQMTPMRDHYEKEINESISIRLASGDFQSDRYDFMSNILNNKSISREELHVLSNGLFMAGVDTTATTILMTLYHLGMNTDKQKKLREEIYAIVGDRESLTRQDLDNLKYLKLCVKESQRLHPAVFQVPRVTKADLILNGYHIPKNSQIVINNYMIGRQAELFPNPEEYIPERWEQPALQSSYYFLPFGYGPRMCVGKLLAELEIYINLTHIVRKFEIEAINNFEVCGFVFLESDRELIFKLVPVE